MRDPSALDAELKAVREKARQLQIKQRTAFGELVQKTGADKLPFEVLAGILLAGVEQVQGDSPEVEEWRQRGAAFFRPREKGGKGAQPASAAPAAAGDGQGAEAIGR